VAATGFAHVSDLHIGLTPRAERAAERLCDALLHEHPGPVLLTGDVTHRGRRVELERFRDLFAPVRGSLYLVVLLTATLFGIAAGTVGATVVLLGIMAGPMMIRTGYDAKLSAGAITAGGTLGILIPPSVMLVVMGPVLGISVLQLYAAAFGPGFLLAGMYIVYTMGRSFINPKLGPPVPEEERVHSLRVILWECVVGLVPVTVLTFATLGAILAGLTTSTEAAAMGAAGAAVVMDAAVVTGAVIATVAIAATGSPIAHVHILRVQPAASSPPVNQQRVARAESGTAARYQ